VFTSDHGEGLMDNGRLMHGSSVSEEAMRTPLFFAIPGQKPRLIPHTVGNIDIVPTLVDLLGGAPRPEHAGRSLVPLFVDAQAAWPHGYFSVTAGTEGIALTRGARKHLFDHKANLHFHFDLASDPSEERDLFDPGNSEHLAMLHEVVEAVPTWFVSKSAKRYKRLLARRLREVNPRRPPHALPTLLALIHAAPTAENLALVARWYEQGDDALRVLILRALFRKDPARFEKLLAAQLTPIADSERAQAFVHALQGYTAAQRAAQRVLQGSAATQN
jgi:hypothetical protein